MEDPERNPLLDGNYEFLKGIPSNQEKHAESQSSHWKGRAAIGTSILLVAVLSAAGIKHQYSTELEVTSVISSTDSTLAPSLSVSFAVGNSVAAMGSDAASFNPLSPWSKIIEPHRETTFQAFGCEGCSSFDWVINDETVLSGEAVVFTPTKTGRHSVKLTTVMSDGSSQTMTEDVMAKYVRREIRSLSDDSLQATLGALKTVFSVSTKEGQALYGDKFKGIADFVSKHLFGSADRECDSWHDDAGFYTHHAAFTLEMEQAMQAVDSTVAMPYWDFTKDAHSYTYFGTDWRDTVVFSDSWFGSIKSGRSDRGVDSGLFAFTEVKQVGVDSTEYPVHNPYGFLRSPWNVNPSPYITRDTTVDNATEFSNSLPSCKDYDSCFAAASISVMNECLNGATHGSVHIQIGGLWDKPSSTYDLIDSSKKYQLLLISKNLWRRGYIDCPEKCSTSDTEALDCSCKISKAAEAYSAYELLTTKSQVMTFVDFFSSKVYYDDSTGKYAVSGVTDPEEEDKIWSDLLHTTIGKLGSVGDMYSSASPYDPTFWIIHGTADRLLQWRRLVASRTTSKPFDNKWGYAHSTIAPSDTNTVCDWDNLNTDGTPTCSKGTCTGHNEFDVLPFGSFVEGGPEAYTNMDMYLFLSPENDDLPFTYDNYMWSHCDEEGYNFGVQADGSVSDYRAVPSKEKGTHKG